MCTAHLYIQSIPIIVVVKHMGDVGHRVGPSGPIVNAVFKVNSVVAAKHIVNRDFRIQRSAVVHLVSVVSR